jgi:hypothetical protein
MIQDARSHEISPIPTSAHRTTSSPRVYCSTASAVHHRRCRFCTILVMMGMMMPETCWDTNKWNQSQQVHTEPPLLHESTAARPVLYTIGVVGFVPFSWWWAWWCPKHVETPINTSSSASSWLFIHLHDSRCTASHEIKIWECSCLMPQSNHRSYGTVFGWATRCKYDVMPYRTWRCEMW